MQQAGPLRNERGAVIDGNLVELSSEEDSFPLAPAQPVLPSEALSDQRSGRALSPPVLAILSSF